jgi:hypothetical protein
MPTAGVIKPKEMTAIEDHGRVPSEAEQELAGQPICQQDRGTTTRATGGLSVGRERPRMAASASNSHLPQVNCKHNENDAQFCLAEKAWLRARPIGGARTFVIEP